MPAKNEALLYARLFSAQHSGSQVEYSANWIEAGLLPSSIDVFFYAVHVQSAFLTGCGTATAFLNDLRSEAEDREHQGLSSPIDDTCVLLEAWALGPKDDPSTEDLLFRTLMMGTVSSQPFMRRTADRLHVPGHWLLCVYSYADGTHYGSITLLPEARPYMMDRPSAIAAARRVIAMDLSDDTRGVTSRRDLHGPIVFFKSAANLWQF